MNDSIRQKDNLEDQLDIFALDQVRLLLSSIPKTHRQLKKKLNIKLIDLVNETYKEYINETND